VNGNGSLEGIVNAIANSIALRLVKAKIGINNRHIRSGYLTPIRKVTVRVFREGIIVPVVEVDWVAREVILLAHVVELCVGNSHLR
jgi:hypothetical protein